MLLMETIFFIITKRYVVMTKQTKEIISESFSNK